MTSSTSGHYVLTLSCPDARGIVRAVAGVLTDAGGNITESQQFGDPDTGMFHMRVQVDVAASLDEVRNLFALVAKRFAMTWHIDVVGRPMRTLVMVSSAGHCLNDLLFREHAGQLGIEVRAIVSNHEELSGLAGFYHVPFHHIPVTAQTKPAAEAQLLELIENLDIELVVLARYMQVLSDDLCTKLAGRAINIHHSFLPSFKGARPYHQAYQRGVKIIGATAHYVTAVLDEGPIIEQDIERVDHSCSPDDLRAIGRDVEAQVLARAVRWHTERRVLRNADRTVVFR